MGLTEVSEESRVVVKMWLTTENSSRSQTVIFTIEAGVEETFGRKYPKLKILTLPIEEEHVPFQISLVAESGQVLSSTTVYYTPDAGAEFSLDADGIDAQGQILALSR
jgi:hypothetical protein